MNKRPYYLYIFLFWFCFFSCEELPCNKSVNQAQLDAVDQTQLQSDIAVIDAYLQSEGITAVADPSGIRYVVEKEGFGGTPCLENLVSFIYTGFFFNSGKEFQSGATEDELRNLILGWQVILTQYPKGTKLTLYIPSGYAYGTEGRKTSETTYSIPPNSILVFDIEIMNIR